jgi:hypothetical protein
MSASPDKVSWWWAGLINVESRAGADSQLAPWASFFEVFPKNASANAMLRVSISDGHTAWQSCFTAPQVLVQAASSYLGGFPSMRAVLDGEQPGRVSVRPGTNHVTGPCVKIWFGDELAAEVHFAERGEDFIDMPEFTEHLLRYLGLIQASNRVLYRQHAETTQDRDECNATVRSKVAEQTKTVDEMATHARRLVTAKLRRFRRDTK